MALALLFSGLAYMHSGTGLQGDQGQQGLQGIPGPMGPQGAQGEQGLQGDPGKGASTQTFGGASGPSHFTFESFLQGFAAGPRDQFSVSNKGVITNNGVDSISVEYPITATSSVPVTIPNPFGATGLAPDVNNSTSTVTAAGCVITNGVTGANTWYLSTSTGPLLATSTPSFFGHSVASASQDSFAWTAGNASTTNAGIGLLGLDGTNPYFVFGTTSLQFKIASTSPGTFAANYYSGYCWAKFVKP